MSDPVGYYCDHSDEPMDERTHHEWDLVDYEGWVFQHKPETISAHIGTQDYLTPEQQKQRCPRAVAVYTAGVVEQARTWAVELENQVARLTDELAKYDGKEPTVAEEMRYLNDCLNAVHHLCDEAKKRGITSGGTFTVEAVEKAADGQRPDNPDDNRRRIYLDGKGHAWISVATDTDGAEYIAPIDSAWVDEGKPTGAVRAETGSLREIGRTW
ncbi:hypothetical protein [Streptomyces sp. NPDC097640]|uniref:hypothetical protein n=1 Tax=Streptomyces sp. NPDC097640 TaxID=3157229 RepID=UPI00332E5556